MSKIEEYEKVNACDPGDVVLIDGSKGTRTIDISLVGSGSATKGDAIVEAVSGPIATFSDGAENQPVKSLVASIVPVQAGTGDPSPENVRPITGRSSCRIDKVSKNVLDALSGFKFLRDNYYHDEIVIDENAKTVVYTSRTTGLYQGLIGTSLNYVPVAEGRPRFPFKENTSYTLIAHVTASTAGNLNFGIGYTDNTNAAFSTADVAYNDGWLVFTTPANKTIKSLYIGVYTGGRDITFYYEDMGIFEGTVTKEEFEAYKGLYQTIAFPSEAGTVYGGTLDVTTGELTVDKAAADMGSLAWSYYPTQYASPFFSANLSDAKAGSEGMTEIGYTPVTTFGALLATDKSIAIVSPTVRIRDDAYTDAAAFKTALSGIKLVYELATPITYHCTPEEVRTLLGSNAIFADTGDISVSYAADTKTYIDDQIAALVATLSTL